MDRNEKVKELLEKIDTVFLRCLCAFVRGSFLERDSNKIGEYAEYIDQAHALLTEQPDCQQPQGEFTKEWRERLQNAITLFKMGRNPDDWFQSIVMGFSEACDLIDRRGKALKWAIREFEAIGKGNALTVIKSVLGDEDFEEIKK